MFAFDAQFMTFLVAVTLLTLSPGVDTMLVLRSALVRGRRAGVLSFALANRVGQSGCAGKARDLLPRWTVRFDAVGGVALCELRTCG